jgi:hypothetical protein
MSQLIPPGPAIKPPYASILQAFYDAISELQNPGSPTQLASVDTKAHLPPAADWPNGAIICAEINSIVCSTQVAGAWTWLRADGAAL